MNKVALFGITLISMIIATSSAASAHVVINSSQGGGKAIFHISPADDPVAGKESTLFFDIESSQSDINNASATLSVTDKTGTKVAIPANVDQGTVSAKYTFPSEGTYTIALVVSSSDLSLEVFQFTHAQIVSPNTKSASPQRQTGNSWLLLSSAVLLLTVAVIVAIKRQDIARSIRASSPKK